MWAKDLAIAIVYQAVQDYCEVEQQYNVRKFFSSEWFELLCDLNPEILLKECERRANEMCYYGRYSIQRQGDYYELRTRDGKKNLGKFSSINECCNEVRRIKK